MASIMQILIQQLNDKVKEKRPHLGKVEIAFPSG